MDWISIIIPTLKWGYHYDNLLKNMEELWYLYSDRFEIIPVFWMKVNEAWNFWVENSKNETVLVINDDILFKKWCVEKMFDVVDSQDAYPVVCPLFTSWENAFEWDEKISTNLICWFCYMMKKKNWIPIDERLQIWYWDNWIYEYTWRRVLRVDWAVIHHFWSQTLKDETKEREIWWVIKKDQEARIDVSREKWREKR